MIFYGYQREVSRTAYQKQHELVTPHFCFPLREKGFKTKLEEGFDRCKEIISKKLPMAED